MRHEPPKPKLRKVSLPNSLLTGLPSSARASSRSVSPSPQAAKASRKPAPKAPDQPPAKRTRGSRRIRPPRLYVYFDAIIRYGSIRRAAEALGIASSALNRRLLDLEQEAGTILFDRLQGGVRLTAAGGAFAAHVRRTLGDLDRVGDHLSWRSRA